MRDVLLLTSFDSTKVFFRPGLCPVPGPLGKLAKLQFPSPVVFKLIYAAADPKSCPNLIKAYKIISGNEGIESPTFFTLTSNDRGLRA